MKPVNKNAFENLTTEDVKKNIAENKTIIKAYLFHSLESGESMLPNRHLFHEKYISIISSKLELHSPLSQEKIENLMRNKAYYHPNIRKTLRLRPLHFTKENFLKLRADHKTFIRRNRVTLSFLTFEEPTFKEVKNYNYKFTNVYF